MPVLYQQRSLSPGGSSAPTDGMEDTVLPQIVLSVLKSRRGESKLPSEVSKSQLKRQRCSRKNSDELTPVNSVSDSTIQEQMELLGRGGVPVCLELFARNCAHKMSLQQSDCILLEQWTMQIIPKRPPAGSINPVQLLQAVESFTHFSQIRAWMVTSGGRLPFELLYRICGPSEDEVCQFTAAMPDVHNFPLASYTAVDTLKVVVYHLPRLSSIPFVSNCKLAVAAAEGISKCLSDSSIDCCTLESKKSLTLSSSMQYLRTSTSRTNSECSKMKFSPKLSSMSSSSFSHCSNGKPVSSVSVDSEGVSHHCSQEFCFDALCLSNAKSPTHNVQLLSPNNCSSSGSINSRQFESPETASSLNSCNSERTSFLKRISAKKLESSGRSKEICGRGKVCPPEASSPIPFIPKAKLTDSSAEDTSQHDCHTGSGLYRRQSLVTPSKHKAGRPPMLRSMSVPSAVSSLSLLGTFEESVLNGRLEPLGVVEGFTAEIGASGSFCPRHVTLPVMALFFSLSDEDGPSPYLGHIDLSSVSRKGYHVPRKGTIQVTLFNPNKTVVKMFVVMYDFTDMPANSQTFLRQRTLSGRPSLQASQKTVPELHYLIHLRFRCSKSGHIYLHTDVRMIFARRAPDIDHDPNNVSLYSITEGPTQPHYTPITSRKS